MCGFGHGVCLMLFIYEKEKRLNIQKDNVFLRDNV